MRTMRGAVVGLLCVVVLALSGCVKIDLDLEVNSDNTVSGSMILGVSKELPNVQQVVDQLRSQLPPDTVSEPWSDEQFVGFRVTYDKLPIDEFSTPTAANVGDTGLGLRREGNFFLVGTPPDGSEPDGPDMSGLQPVYRVRLTFPGPVVEGNGTIDGNSIEWTDNTVTPYAKARANSVVLVPVLIGAGVVLILLAAGLLVVLAIRHQRTPQQAVPTTGAADPFASNPPPTNQYGPDQYGTGQDWEGVTPSTWQTPGADTPGTDGSPWQRPPEDHQSDGAGSESPWQRPE